MCAFLLLTFARMCIDSLFKGNEATTHKRAHHEHQYLFF